MDKTSKWRPKKTLELTTLVIELYNNGIPYVEIGKRIGVDRNTISRWLDDKARVLKNKKRRKRRSDRYTTDILFQIKLRLRLARVRAEKQGYAVCSSTPEEILATITDYCECCDRHKSICGTLHLDHWHEPPGKFRAWLCGDCNRAIGMLQDNPTILRRAADLLDHRRNEYEKGCV